MLDGDFISRVYRTTAIVSVIAVLLALRLGQVVVAAGLVIGTLVGIGTLYGVEWVVRRAARPGATSSGKTLAKYAAVKYTLLAAVVTPVVFTRDPVCILAFIGGYTLIYLVILLKVVGITLNERLNR